MDTLRKRNLFKKVEQEQTNRMVLNLQDWAGDFDALKREFTDHLITVNLEEIIIIKNDGSILKFYPF